MSFIGNNKIAARVEVYDAELRDKVTELEAQVETAYADGQKSEYDRFWDNYQDNGNRRNYANGFVREGWRTEIFKPKYPIIATGDASYMFDNSRIGNWDNPDFDFVEQGVELDVSGATSLTYMFRNCKGIKRVGVIDTTGCKDLNRLFYQSGVETIDEFKVKDTTTYDNTFALASKVKNITVSGTIGKSINFQNCPLSTDSMISIITHLKNFYSDEASWYTQTLYFSEECWAALAERDEESPSYGFGIGWRGYAESNMWNT